MDHQRPVAPRCPAPLDARHCPRPAGFGTDHPGTGNCRQHELGAAATARAERAGCIPQTIFQEPVYVDGLPYENTVQGMAAEDDSDDWEAAA